jgi:ketosteroid isomerase-like protein
MSQENVGIVQTGFEAFAKGDLEAAFAILAQDVRWEGVPDVEPCRTREEVEQTIRFNYEAGPLTEADEFIAAGDQVVVGFRVIGETFEPYRGRERVYVVCTLRDGKVFLMRDFLERGEALEAAGVRE